MRVYPWQTPDASDAAAAGKTLTGPGTAPPKLPAQTK